MEAFLLDFLTIVFCTFAACAALGALMRWICGEAPQIEEALTLEEELDQRRDYRS